MLKEAEVTETAGTQTTVEVTIDTSGTVPWVPAITVKPGDFVLFHANRDIVSISFPATGVFPTTEIVTAQTDDIKVWIPSSATPDTYEYAIYVHGDTNKYAVCHSHPVMVVESPEKP